MAFRPSPRRRQLLNAEQLAKAKEYAQSTINAPRDAHATLLFKPSRGRLRLLERLLAPVSLKPTPALGSGTNWLYFVDPPVYGSGSLLPSGSPRRISLSLALSGLGILPDAFSNRVWAGGKLTWALGPRPRRIEISRDWLRVVEGVDSIAARDLDGDAPMFKLKRRLWYRLNLRDSAPMLVEERTHAFMPEGIPRKVRPVDDLRTPSIVRAGIVPDALMLFRYSMATQNAHRIHYDYNFARQEGFEDVVVHGPLTASLLLHLLTAKRPAELAVHSFEYRNTNALYANRALTLCIAFRDPPRGTPPVFDPPPPPTTIPERAVPYLELDPRDARYQLRSVQFHDTFHEDRQAAVRAQLSTTRPRAGDAPHFAKQAPTRALILATPEEQEPPHTQVVVPNSLADVRRVTPYEVALLADLWAVDVNGVVGMRASAVLVHAPRQRMDGFAPKRPQNAREHEDRHLIRPQAFARMKERQRSGEYRVDDM